MPRKPRRRTEPTPDFTATNPPIPGSELDELYRTAGGDSGQAGEGQTGDEQPRDDDLAARASGEPASTGDLPPQQQPLVDGEGQPIAPIHDRITAYVDLRDRHAGLTKLLTEAKAALIEEMREHDLTTYSARGFTVTITTTTGVKVDTA